MKPNETVLHFLLRRTIIMLIILFKFCLFLPIPIFMVLFSYRVDISGLFQGDLAPREVAFMLLDGNTVSNYDQMDERQVLELYVQNLPEDQVPETLALGSSRVLQMTSEIAGGSFFNGGMSGAGLMDIANSWYLFERADKLPKNLILCVDPWLFNGDSAADLNKKADSQLFAEFMEKALGRPTDYQEPDKLALWKALVDPAYFQGNVRYYLQQHAAGQATNENGDSIPFQPLTGDISQLDQAVKRADGSVQYPYSFRSWDHDQVMAEVLNQAGTMVAMHGFTHMDSYWTTLFADFVAHVQQKGVHVIFLLTPYHPFICLNVQRNPQGLEGFFQVEPWLRDYAEKHNIPLYGSYHAGRIGIPEAMFFDGVHCKGDALKLIFPGIKDAQQGLPTVYQELYLEKYGDVFNSRNALIGIDPDCPVPDADPKWFAQASSMTREEFIAEHTAA